MNVPVEKEIGIVYIPVQTLYNSYIYHSYLLFLQESEIPLIETSLFPNPCSQFARDINLFKIAALSLSESFCDTIITKRNI